MEDIMYTFSPDDPEGTKIVLDPIYLSCAKATGVSKTTVRRWWRSYIMLGELPYETKEREKKLAKRFNWLPKKAKINDDDLKALEKIVDDNPLSYLDELTVLFGRQTGKYFRPSTIWRYLKYHLKLSLQVLRKRAQQQCELTQAQFKKALSLLLQNDPRRLVLIDETHKDRNAARRKRGWGKRNRKLGETILTEWYKSSVRYTLIAAADINGFIEMACDTVRRDSVETDDPLTGASGTVDTEYFINWLRTKLCPTLGDYSKGEPRSVVLLDNATIHHSDEIENLITATGATFIYSAPYSPHLNPIENYFSIYKAYLKFLGEEQFQTHNWEASHKLALGRISPDHGINYFRACGIPGACDMKTSDEIALQI
mmetsp:Transcript_12865/g.14996  ORF Transcript_12865/g.14996 Transcript_12865/m.14996 type:complete len:370 (-) Transcript_12865:33-1142(-)